MRLITKRSRWGTREFIAPSIVGLDRDGRATSRIAARFLRGSATRSGPTVQLSSFRTVEGVCSRLLPSHDRSLSEAARQKEVNAGEWSDRGASDRVVRRKRLRGVLATTSYGFDSRCVPEMLVRQ